VRVIASAMCVRYTLVTGFTSADIKVCTLLFWADDTSEENTEYKLGGRSFEPMLGGDVRYYPRGVQAIFLSDTQLANLEAEICLIIPLGCIDIQDRRFCIGIGHVSLGMR
jgi:hypothetical protein